MWMPQKREKGHVAEFMTLEKKKEKQFRRPGGKSPCSTSLRNERWGQPRRGEKKGGGLGPAIRLIEEGDKTALGSR